MAREKEKEIISGQHEDGHDRKKPQPRPKQPPTVVPKLAKVSIEVSTKTETKEKPLKQENRIITFSDADKKGERRHERLENEEKAPHVAIEADISQANQKKDENKSLSSKAFKIIEPPKKDQEIVDKSTKKVEKSKSDKEEEKGAPAQCAPREAEVIHKQLT